MKILFLDIDGVVHPAGGSKRSLNKGSFYETNMINLAKIFLRSQSHLQIVLSSSWRTSAARVNVVNRQLRRYGMPMIFGCTPFLPDSTRVNEIWTWLKEYETKRMEKPQLFEPIDGYLCLDDMDLSVLSNLTTPSPLANHCCHVSSEVGLSHGSIKRCVCILQRPPHLPHVDIFPSRPSSAAAAQLMPWFHAKYPAYLTSEHTKKTTSSSEDAFPLPTRFTRSPLPPFATQYSISSKSSARRRARRRRLTQEEVEVEDDASASSSSTEEERDMQNGMMYRKCPEQLEENDDGSAWKWRTEVHTREEIMKRPKSRERLDGTKKPLKIAQMLNHSIRRLGGDAVFSVDAFQRKAHVAKRVTPLCSHVQTMEANVVF
eukprot:GEMP01035064.1.p1 GENE.GEMP01035064.1~~GEMP01035064.1.p1  ORF type:complete len:374 (+),score=85.36 GEMP01035064.1:83-1204(+)